MYFLRVGACVTITQVRSKKLEIYGCIPGKNGQKLTVKQVEYAVRKYRRHRSVPQSIINGLWKIKNSGYDFREKRVLTRAFCEIFENIANAVLENIETVFELGPGVLYSRYKFEF